MQQLQQRLQMSHGSCGSHSNGARLAGACRRKLLQQLQRIRHGGGSCRAHLHSNLCRSHGCSGDHTHGRSHLQDNRKS